MTVTNDLDLGQMLADTEAEILRVVGEREGPTSGVYEQIRYHLGLDGSDGPRAPKPSHLWAFRVPRQPIGALLC